MATYNTTVESKDEGHYMQILRQNEMMLLTTGKLWNTRDAVVSAAEILLDADLQS